MYPIVPPTHVATHGDRLKKCYLSNLGSLRRQSSFASMSGHGTCVASDNAQRLTEPSLHVNGGLGSAKRTVATSQVWMNGRWVWVEP